MEKMDHIGIAVKNLQEATEKYALLLGTPPFKEEYVPGQDVTVVFFKQGETKIELLSGEGEANPVAKFIKNKGEGIHHMAYLVNDIREEMKRLDEAGFQLIDWEPRDGADNKLVCFVHPKSCNGVLVELCQSKTS